MQNQQQVEVDFDLYTMQAIPKISYSSYYHEQQ
jgi:hypothetical protein